MSPPAEFLNQLRPSPPPVSPAQARADSRGPWTVGGQRPSRPSASSPPVTLPCPPVPVDEPCPTQPLLISSRPGEILNAVGPKFVLPLRDDDPSPALCYCRDCASPETCFLLGLSALYRNRFADPRLYFCDRDVQPTREKGFLVIPGCPGVPNRLVQGRGCPLSDWPSVSPSPQSCKS